MNVNAGCAMVAALLVACAVGVAGEAAEKLAVEVEWAEYMRCPACEALAKEIANFTEASYGLPNQEGRFKMKVEREDWVMKHAVPTAAREYAFVTTNPEYTDQRRGRFVYMPHIAEEFANPEVLEGLDGLRNDPIYSLEHFIGLVAYELDDEIMSIIDGRSSKDAAVNTLCHVTDYDGGPLCKVKKMKKKKAAKKAVKKATEAAAEGKKKVKKRLSELKDEL